MYIAVKITLQKIQIKSVVLVFDDGESCIVGTSDVQDFSTSEGVSISNIKSHFGIEALSRCESELREQLVFIYKITHIISIEDHICTADNTKRFLSSCNLLNFQFVSSLVLEWDGVGSQSSKVNLLVL